MLYAYTNTPLTVLTNDNISFSNTALVTGITARLGSDDSSIYLNRPGIYKIEFMATGSTADESGTVTVSLYADNNIVNGATSTFTSTSTTDIDNMYFSSIVSVPSCCPFTPRIITLRNVGVGTIYSNVAVIVTKIA